MGGVGLEPHQGQDHLLPEVFCMKLAVFTLKSVERRENYERWGLCWTVSHRYFVAYADGFWWGCIAIWSGRWNPSFSCISSKTWNSDSSALQKIVQCWELQHKLYHQVHLPWTNILACMQDALLIGLPWCFLSGFIWIIMLSISAAAACSAGPSSNNICVPVCSYFCTSTVHEQNLLD